ncbi:molybdopterin-dependent oxidoreductase [Anatilimnocola floriformis]|uniref:molybdopterin-dependent oxidoreductase n=1 Tax=Anatilimnocola floriformis TaxID=2948575 RepID=UPI0020C28694|nr:molybdopterin-dependent oxidoreductase [Anatilimnocola floriformis]
MTLSRREFVQTSSVLTAAALSGGLLESPVAAAEENATERPFLTPADKFRDVSRGTPKPHSLVGEALVAAKLTPETWRLEITIDGPATPEQKEFATGKELKSETDNSLDLAALLELGKKHEVQFLKAMQCLNIPAPLGQGLWEGVPLRDVLRLCSPLKNVRRIYYWGFHNNDPKQLFQSSLSYTQAMETPPGELPAFLAYRLNGEPIPLMRGGPVRMVIPWAHGFKSIKWLQRICLTNDYKANDTYAEQNNDPESYLKTAAYFENVPAKVAADKPLRVSGTAMSGLSGLKRVEYSLTSDENKEEKWIPAALDESPSDWSTQLPAGISSKQILGFDPKTGEPRTWPLRYSMVGWSLKLTDLKPGQYALRVRAVDLNDFAQPEPRPIQKTGRNSIEVKEFEVVG